MKKIALDPRLQTLGDMVGDQKRIADIGTDHGYLITWIAQNRPLKKGYACDINESPLERAAETIKLYGVEDKVKLVLTSGLHGLDGKGIRLFIIAGLGGELIGEIIKQAPWAHTSRIEFLLQPMTRESYLRRWLYASGFEIREERGVVSGRHSYVCMRVGYTGEPKDISMHFAWSGLVWNQSDNASLAYLKNRFAQLIKQKPSLEKEADYQPMVKLWTERLGES